MPTPSQAMLRSYSVHLVTSGLRAGEGALDGRGYSEVRHENSGFLKKALML
jgi:hypothetical protein